MKGRWFCCAVIVLALIHVVGVCYGLITGVFEGKITHNYSPEKAKRNYGESAAVPRFESNYGRLPLYFIENRGQVDGKVKYYAAGKGHTMFFTGEGLVLSLMPPHEATGEKPVGSPVLDAAGHLGIQVDPGETHRDKVSIVRVTPVGIKKDVRMKAYQRQQGLVNYFVGKDPAKWRTGIPTYAGVLYEEAYQGVDLKFYGRGRELEYDVVVQPGADPGQVRFAYDGVQDLRLTPEGHLALKLPDGGELIQKKPVVYQEIAGQRVGREARYAVQKSGARLVAGFEVAAYDKRYALVIDPVLVYSTYLGGNNYDEAYAIAADGSGAVYVAGYTSSTNYPTSNAFQGTFGGGTYNAFISKINPAGNGLVFSTYLGGSGEDRATAIAVDGSGNVYLAGYTTSSNFPVTAGALQTTKTNSQNAFITKLNSDGGTLGYSTYLGGSAGDSRALGIAVDTGGNAYVTGGTASAKFPTTAAAPQIGFYGLWAAFISKINPTGSALVYSTYLGGVYIDSGNAIAVDASGAAYVSGQASSPNFPTTVNALQRNSGGGYSDAFVTKINPAGTAWAYSTFLGGNGDDYGKGIAVDAGGNAFVTGFTSSQNFPTTAGVPQRTFGGGSYNAFISKINPAGSALLYSTYVGGNVQDMANAIAVDGTGAATIAGSTASPNFPTTADGAQKTLAGGRDAFVTKLSPAGDSLVYSTYLGGTTWSWANGIAVDAAGAFYVAGYTFGNFPVYRALQYSYGGGGGDAFVAKIGDAPPRPKGSIVPVISLLLLLDN